MTATFGLSPSAPPRPLVVHPFVPAHRAHDQHATWELLESLESFDVRHCVCDDTFAYAQALAKLWDADADLILLEHDNAPTPAQIADLLACPEPVCTVPYWIGPASTGLVAPIISIASRGARPEDTSLAHADHSAIGCCKLSAAWRRSVGPLPRVLWYAVESVLNVRVVSSVGTWHVHWPTCQHTHGGHIYA